MRFLAVLCLLSAAVALPTPEQLHTNLPALPPPPEIKSEEKDKSSDEKVALDMPQAQIEEEHEKSAEKPSESEEKPKVEEDEHKENLDDVIQNDSKESKEVKDSKENSKESKELKEPWEPRPDEPKEEKKEKDSKSEESKEKDDEDLPVIIQVISRPKGFFYDLFSKWFPNKLPWPFGRTGWRNGDLQDQPIYIVSESDYDLD